MIAKKIGVIGMGYVGIPAAVLFADKYEKVYGFQRDSPSSGYKIDMLNCGENPLVGEEPYLDELLKEVVERKRFECTSDFSLLSEMDAITISVQTPFVNKKCLVPDIQPLTDALTLVGKNISEGALVVIESTITPGTTNGYAKKILEMYSKMSIDEDEIRLAHAPERVMVGRLIDNIRNHDRIVGGVNEQSTRSAEDLYTPILVKGKVIPMTATAAEVTKTTENTFRDLQIAAANQLALYCESMGVNFYDVKKGVDSLKGEGVTRAMLNPGAGVGGHCLTKDTYHLERGAQMLGDVDFPMGEQSLYITARNINDFMPMHMYNLLLDAFSTVTGNITIPPTVVVLGWSFIADSGDTRDSPSESFVEILKKNGITYRIHDPYVKGYDNDFKDTVKGTDALVIFTGHKQYRWDLMDPFELKKIMGKTHPIVIDGRNIVNADDYINKGFVYRGVGRGDKNNH